MSQEVYGLLRDFQPLLAALVALGAAIIAYVSAQRVASRQAATTLLDRLSFAERTLSYNDLYEGGITRQNRQNVFILSDLEHVPLLLQNEWNINVGWGDLALLELPTQRAIYNVTTVAVSVDNSINEMKTTLQRDLPITKFAVDGLVDRSKTAIQTVEETITFINSSVAAGSAGGP